MPGEVSRSSDGPDGSVLDAKIRIVTAPRLGGAAEFVEIETADGRGVRVGEWDCDSGVYNYLYITPRGILKALGLSEDPEKLSCAYCGFSYEGDQGVTRDILTAHIEDCPEHPVMKRLRELTLAVRGVLDTRPLDSRQGTSGEHIAALVRLRETLDEHGTETAMPRIPAYAFMAFDADGRRLLNAETQPHVEAHVLDRGVVRMECIGAEATGTVAYVEFWKDGECVQQTEVHKLPAFDVPQWPNVTAGTGYMLDIDLKLWG